MIRLLKILFGIGGGALVGLLLAVVLAEPLVTLFHVSSFEGEIGYFVFFCTKLWYKTPLFWL